MKCRREISLQRLWGYLQKKWLKRRVLVSPWRNCDKLSEYFPLISKPHRTRWENLSLKNFGIWRRVCAVRILKPCKVCVTGFVLLSGRIRVGFSVLSTSRPFSIKLNIAYLTWYIFCLLFFPAFPKKSLLRVIWALLSMVVNIFLMFPKVDARRSSSHCLIWNYIIVAT